MRIHRTLLTMLVWVMFSPSLGKADMLIVTGGVAQSSHVTDFDMFMSLTGSNFTLGGRGFPPRPAGSFFTSPPGTLSQELRHVEVPVSQTATLTINGVRQGGSGPPSSTIEGALIFESGSIFIGDTTPIPFTMSGNLIINNRARPDFGSAFTEHKIIGEGRMTPIFGGLGQNLFTAGASYEFRSSVIPEPETWILFLTAFVLMVLVVIRKGALVIR